MNKYQATLFSNESDIYTALHSNSAKITDVTLRKIAFNRGIIFPSDLSKEVLIEKYQTCHFHIITSEKYKINWQPNPAKTSSQ
jgi:hypothetical protein